MLNKVRLNKVWEQYAKGLISEIEMAIEIRQMADKVISRIEIQSINAITAIKTMQADNSVTKDI